MRKTLIRTVSIAASLIVSANVSATQVCHQVTGKIAANDISQSEALGLVEMKIENKEVEGAIYTLVLGVDTTTIPIVSSLQQTIEFPRNGVVYTKINSARFVPLPSNSCVFSVVEQLNIVGGTGQFTGAVGTANAVGSVNFCTGQHKLTFTGSYCAVQ